MAGQPKQVILQTSMVRCSLFSFFFFNKSGSVCMSTRVVGRPGSPSVEFVCCLFSVRSLVAGKRDHRTLLEACPKDLQEFLRASK